MEFSFIKDNSILLNLGLAYLEQTLIKLWYAVFGTVSVGMIIPPMLQKLAHTEYPNKSEWLAHIKLIFHQSVQFIFSIMISLKEHILNFKIDCPDEAWELAKFLVEMIGLNFYQTETYKITNDLGLRVKRIPFFKENERYNTLFDLGLLNKPYKKALKDLIKRATLICDSYAPCSFADMLCNCTEASYRNNHVQFMSGEEEAEECNRQFNSMMNDFDAWGNIYD